MYRQHREGEGATVSCPRQQRGPRRRRACRSSTSAMLYSCLASALIFFQHAEAFSVMTMSSSPASSDKFSYQPPVKTSVEQLRHHSKRFSSSTKGSGTNSGGGSGSAQKAMAGTLSMPSPGGIGARSFEERMRDLVLGGENTKADRSEQRRHSAETPSTARNTVLLPPNVQRIESLQEYKRVVGDERQKIVAVRFYASYCKACQAVAPHFYHLAKQFPDTIFVDVPVTERNAALHQGLGIPTLPFAHIYHPTGGLVEELKLTRNHVTTFKVKLASYVEGSCPLTADESECRA